MNQSPLLSIGIIFKNEVRCLERCLKSLQPLREALPCELIMADTGATDGSREIAAKYADILFDFPWIGDFSAARNAVMDRSSGKWYMTIDCDEWVDPNIQGFVKFLTTDETFDFASLIIRNYFSEELESGGTYSDFLATRLVRMSTGLRYDGKVHEHWTFEGDFQTMMISDAIFHHDGYLFQDESKMMEKQERNMEPLREQLRRSPNDLVILMQCIESSEKMKEQNEYLRRALVGVKEKWSQWEMFGGPIYRYAVQIAIRDKLPELKTWIKEAEEYFPDSIFTRVEVSYYAFGTAWNEDNYADSLYWGEKFIQGVADYRAGNFERGDLLASSLDKTDAHSWLSVAVVLASGYLHEKQPEKCQSLMETFNGREMDAKQSGDCVRNLCDLHRNFDVDTAPLLLRIWEEINEPVPNQKRAEQRREAFIRVGMEMFVGDFIHAEFADMATRDYACAGDDSIHCIHHAYSTFFPLKGKCVLGDAAVMLETQDPAALKEMLCGVKKIEDLPIRALYHAIECGVPFPLEEKPLKIEQTDLLAARLAQEKDLLLNLVLDRVLLLDERNNTVWARALVLAAVSAFDWKEKEKEKGLKLARVFAATEQAYLPLCYLPDVLQKENLDILPPMHRFGWYLVRAFEALDAGNTTEYIRLLKEGINSCEKAKSIVGFLVDCTPELQLEPEPEPPAPSGELLELANQVRAILSQFSPDDPAVVALKQSEAYQKVAYLIETTESVAAAPEAPVSVVSVSEVPAEAPREKPKGKHVLMAAYFFPPLSGSGVFRSIKFAKYLSLFGWQPTVISTDRPPNDWEFTDESQLSEIPENMEVIRIPDPISTGNKTSLSGDEMDALLNFLWSVLRFSSEADGIYRKLTQTLDGAASLLTFPCNALYWAYEAVQYIEKNINLSQFDVIYTTSGPHSAHLIGFYFHQNYGIPWVADYRDPWTFNAYFEEDYDPSDQMRKLLFECESVLLQEADVNLTVNDLFVPVYKKEFGLPDEKIVSISNGYDEEDFTTLETPQGRTDRFTINYSGLLYTDQRRLDPIFTAIRQLADEKKIDLSQVRFHLVGEDANGGRALAEKYGLSEIFEHTGYCSHREALQANLNADLLLLLVGDDPKFKPVPTGKFFEYLRSGRPILALAPKDGIVDRVLRKTGHGKAFLSIQNSGIKSMILREYKKWKHSKGEPLLHSLAIERFERKVLTKQLAEVLDAVILKDKVKDIRDELQDNSRPMQAASISTEKKKYLVICGGGYPTQENPRCIFAHQRVLQYIKAGYGIDAFGFIWGTSLVQYEYEGVSVYQGGVPELIHLLEGQAYEKILIHFTDMAIMYAIQRAGKLDMPMVVWCHGYEILRWHRSYFSYSADEIQAGQTEWEKIDEKKAGFFQHIFRLDNIHFVFVSNWMKKQVKEAIGILPLHYSVIPNFIDCDFYRCAPKRESDRMKVLCIKSHSSKVYAMDLAAKAILELSKREVFDKLCFELYGDGKLFESNYEELLKHHFKNVHIHRTYLTHDEMKRLFEQNGIFLSPTRSDTQGVSACEAMSAGLSVISCNTAAVPEFMNDECASLFEFDNYFQLADEIEYLYKHPGEFLRKSQNAVKRVNEQCGYDATIKKELQLIAGNVAAHENTEEVSQLYRSKNSQKSLADYMSEYVRDPNENFSSKDYWENRYSHGGTSGTGSYHRLAAFKAEIINGFITEHQVSSIIEWGCGDGNQLGLFLPVQYIGYDVSKTAVEICQKKYHGSNKSFIWYDGTRQKAEKKELGLSLDVIYHLIEDDVFENYMYNLFTNSSKYVCIYSSNDNFDVGLYQKNRKFTDYVQAKFPQWKLIDYIENRYPFDFQDPDHTSSSDFYFYERV